jgi:large-conductance mechanosensitive channel
MPKTNKRKVNRVNPNVMSNSGNIRLQQATTRDRSPRQNPLIVLAPDELVGGFVNFLRSHAIVTLAVGFVIATQVQTVIKQLVTSFITPTFQLFVKGSLAKDSVSLHLHGRVVSYSWGVFISDLLDFLFVLAALYLIIRFFKLDKFETPKETK